MRNGGRNRRDYLFATFAFAYWSALALLAFDVTWASALSPPAAAAHFHSEIPAGTEAVIPVQSARGVALYEWSFGTVGGHPVAFAIAVGLLVSCLILVAATLVLAVRRKRSRAFNDD